MSERLKNILIYAVSIGILAFVYFSTLYSPAKELENQLTKNITELNKKTEQHKVSIEELKKAQELPPVTSEKDQFKGEIPQKLDVGVFLKYISQTGEALNIQFLRFQPEPKERRKLYLILPFQLKVQGKFHQVVGFFDKITSTDKLITVTNIKITSGPRESDTQLVTATARITTYQKL